MSIVAVMANNERRSSFQSTYPSAWAGHLHNYPHTAHGTATTEHPSYFPPNMPHMPMESSLFRAGLQHQRAMPAQLQPLIMPAPQMTMPQYPSELNSHSHIATYQQSAYQQLAQPIQPVPMGQITTPVSASSNYSTRSGPTPRKTLTDAERKRMCEYAEKNPSAKQTEIGIMFGVERSTVSKVLRQKERFLKQDEEKRSPRARSKGRGPDIERALALWAKNRERKGVRLTDDVIRQQAQVFAATSSSPDGFDALTPAWMEKFKLKHNLMGARSRKGSLAPDDADILSTLSTSQTPSCTSPIATPVDDSSSPKELRSAESTESLKNESPDGYVDFSRPFYSRSSTSLHSAFNETAPSSFSPNALSPRSPFFTPDSGTASDPFVPPLTARPILPASTPNNSQRSRSQTFPQFETYLNTGTADVATPRYIPNAMLDSPMEEASEPLIGITEMARLGEPEEKPHTVSPSDMMRPPPLPAHVEEKIKREMTPITSPPSVQVQKAITSTEEARRALGAVMAFLEQQPDGFLSFAEGVSMSKIMEKLTLHAHAGT